MKTPTPQRAIITDLLTRFPKAPSLTLAKMAYKENPKCFKDVESVRGLIRTQRGVSGVRQRGVVADKSNFRPRQKPGDPFGKIPEARNPFDTQWGTVQIDGPLRCLVLADIHLPFHDRDALRAALIYGLA